MTRKAVRTNLEWIARDMEYTIIKNDSTLSFDEFYALGIKCFPGEPMNEVQFSENIKAEYWTVRADSVFIGFVSAAAHEDRVHLSKLMVKEEYRGSGIGGALIDEVIAFAKEKNIPFVTLTVRNENKPAYELYIKKGFKAYGFRIRYAIPVGNLNEAFGVELELLGEGWNTPVTFVSNGRIIGTGKFNREIGGCKDFVLYEPFAELSGTLYAIGKCLKPGSTHLYIMTEDLKTDKALKLLDYDDITDMTNMKYML